MPLDKPTEFLIRFDISQDIFNPYWHIEVAAFLHCVSVVMMQGLDIPSEFKDPKTGVQLGEVVILGEQSTEEIPSVSLADFTDIFKDVEVTPCEGGISLSLPKEHRPKGGK